MISTGIFRMFSRICSMRAPIAEGARNVTSGALSSPDTWQARVGARSRRLAAGLNSNLTSPEVKVSSPGTERPQKFALVKSMPIRPRSSVTTASKGLKV